MNEDGEKYDDDDIDDDDVNSNSPFLYSAECERWGDPSVA